MNDDNDVRKVNRSLSESIFHMKATIDQEINKLSEREASLIGDWQTLKEGFLDIQQREARLVKYADELASRKRKLDMDVKSQANRLNEEEDKVADEKRKIEQRLKEMDRQSRILACKRESLQHLSEKIRKQLDELTAREQEFDAEKDEIEAHLRKTEELRKVFDCMQLQNEIDDVRQEIQDIETKLEQAEASYLTRKLDLVERKSDVAKVKQREMQIRREILTFENKHATLKLAIESKRANMKRIEAKYKEKGEDFGHGKQRTNVIHARMQERLKEVDQRIAETTPTITELKKQIDEKMFCAREASEEASKIKTSLKLRKSRNARMSVKWKNDLDEIKDKRTRVECKKDHYKRRLNRLTNMENEQMERVDRYKARLAKAEICRKKICKLASKVSEKEEWKKVEERRQGNDFVIDLNKMRDIGEKIAEAEQTQLKFDKLIISSEKQGPMMRRTEKKSKTGAMTKELRTARKEVKELREKVEREKQNLENLRSQQLTMTVEMEQAERIVRYLTIKRDLKKSELELERSQRTNKYRRECKYLKNCIKEFKECIINHRNLVTDKQQMFGRVARAWNVPPPFQRKESNPSYFKDLKPSISIDFLERSLQMLLVETSFWKTKVSLPVKRLLDSWLARVTTAIDT